MSRLNISLHNCQSEQFSRQLKQALQQLEAGTLPLQQATTQGGYVDDSNISATVLVVREDRQAIVVRVGIFFNEIVGGCSCGDDALSANVYCEIQVAIDRATAEAEFTLTRG